MILFLTKIYCMQNNVLYVDCDEQRLCRNKSRSWSELRHENMIPVYNSAEMWSSSAYLITLIGWYLLVGGTPAWSPKLRIYVGY